MNEAFSGFDTPRRSTPLPEQFFTELLSQIDHLGELKLSLYAIRLHGLLPAPRPYFSRADLAADASFMAGLGANEAQQAQILDEALQRAVERRTLVRVDLAGGGPVYLLNSPRGRAAAQALAASGAASAGTTVPSSVRPNIFSLYEQNIGPLTPMLAEGLQEAEAEYPPDWIEDAIRIAVENNIRKWRYVDAILRSWHEKGRDERKDQQESEKDRRKYIQGEFSEFIEN